MNERELFRRIRALLGWSALNRIDDSGPVQKAQIGGTPCIDGSTEVHDEVPVLGQYGLSSSPPEGSDLVVGHFGGERSLAVVLASNCKTGRPTGLEPGETALYNGKTGKLWKMASDAIAHLNGDAAIDGSLTATGDVTATGKVTSTGAMAAGNGATGTFISQDGKHVTVVKGIVTQIV